MEPDESKSTAANPAMAADPMMSYMMMGTGFRTNEPVDYDTGTVLVDVVKSDRWMGRTNLQRRQGYEEILFTKDGVNIERLAIQERNWPPSLRAAAKRIKDAESEVAGASTELDAGRMRPGEMMRPDMMMDPMMMQMMMRGRDRRTGN